MCHTSNVNNIVDYILCSDAIVKTVHNFEVIESTQELNHYMLSCKGIASMVTDTNDAPSVNRENKEVLLNNHITLNNLYKY